MTQPLPKSKHMKKLLLIVSILFLTGCDNSITDRVRIDDYEFYSLKEFNQETKHKHNYSMETRGEDVNNNNKINSFNNSRIINNNSNFNNSIEEENSIKEINDELNKYQIENGLFEKSVVSSKYYNILKAKTELSTLKHKMIKMKQIINQKEEEIDEIRNRAKMKNIIFQSGILGRNMTELHKIKTRNKEIENISIPAKNLQYENLKKELEYYTKKNRSAMAESKDASENYFSIKNQFDEKTKLCNNLQGKNSNLKFKLNTLKQADIKKTMALKVLHKKLILIPESTLSYLSFNLFNNSLASSFSTSRIYIT